MNSNNRACNTNTSAISFTRPNGTLSLKRFVLGVFANSTIVTILGLKNSITVFNYALNMAANQFGLFSFNGLNIDTMIINSTPQGQTPIINIDEICYTV